MQCKLLDCHEEVDKAVRGHSQYCSEYHRNTAHLNNIARRRARKAGKRLAPCLVDGCLMRFVVNEGQEICPSCLREGFELIKGEWVQVCKFDRNISSSQEWKDHRSAICNRGKDGLCDEYEDCLDKLCNKEQSKYQEHGVDCWHKQDRPTRNNQGGSFAVCSVNSSAR